MKTGDYFDYEGEPHAICGMNAELFADIRHWLASVGKDGHYCELGTAANGNSYTITIKRFVPKVSEAKQ